MREFNTREAKGNYSITFETDDRKAFEQVQTLCRILIDGKDGDVIPIEWIKKWEQKDENYFLFMDLTKKLIEDWEKENGLL